ncbi:hypothetical protein [Cohnella yongneupensis]|uniref:Uncharacterized protein n=1 Tax=Cohnella yongneupensis TaxID=425006 RepID=A0ABW0QZV4_9BACL
MNRQYFKFNSDDILEILTEYLAEKHGFGTFQSKAILLGDQSNGIRMVAIIGELEDDEIMKTDLEELDKDMKYNGDH